MMVNVVGSIGIDHIDFPTAVMVKSRKTQVKNAIN
jgi:hypothetical protein